MKAQENCWKTLDTRQRLAYFKDYYLMKSIGILAIIAIITYLCFSIFHKDETILYVACIDDVLDSKEVEKLEETLKAQLGSENKHDSVIVDDSFYTSEDGLHKLQVYLSNNQIDIIVADQDTFKQLAACGFMLDLNQILDGKEEKDKETFVYTAGYKDSDDISFEDQETGKGEVQPYGIKLQGNTEYKGLAGMLNNPVVGCAANTKRTDNVKKILEAMSK